MKIRNDVFIFIFFLILSFSWGFLSAHYAFFPFKQLLTFKETLFDESTVPSENLYWKNKVDIFSSNHSTAKNVMVGDSMTERGEWQEYFPGISIVNRGIAGDTTNGVIKRLDSIVSLKPEAAFIILGINDILTEMPVEKVADTYIKILKKLQENGITPIIQSTLYIGKSHPNSDQVNANVEKLNEILMSYANKKGLTFVNLNKFLASDKALKDDFTNDFVHLNGNAYQIWKGAIEGNLKR